MKKTIKLRDLTKEQLSNLCGKGCEKCPLHIVTTNAQRYCAYVIKDMNRVLSDEFLDQPIKIEVPDLLTEEEKELLKDFDYFSLNSLTAIKIRLIGDSKLLTLYHGSDDFYVEFYVKNYLFKGLTEDNIYRVSDLGLEVK